MIIKLYSTSDDLSVMDKTITGEIPIEIENKKGIDIMNPIIDIGYDASYLNKNYVYIPDLQRYYYFSKPPVLEIGQKITLYLHVDVLMSFKASIKSSIGQIFRTNIGNDFLHDDLITPTARHTILTRKMGTGFTKADKYIITIGGNS